MIADLLTKLEDEKEQWIYDAIDRFHGQFMDLNGRWYETGEGTAENQIMNMKSSIHSLRKQRNLELETKQLELKTIEARLLEDERTYENLVTAIEFLNKELVLYTDQLQSLEKVQWEKYHVLLNDKFTFDKKNQVVFKERKISKLMESYQMAEMELDDFYQRQLSTIWVLLSRSMENINSAAKVDFKMDPPLVGLSLKYGRGLNQYIKPGNFEEDFRIVRETLEENNDLVYRYYESQVNQFKEKGIEDIKLLSTQKKEHKRLAEENLHELQEMRKRNEKRMLELQDELGSEEIERNQELLEPKLLDDLLKEEFVKTVSRWQDKVFAENVSDEERWLYHQYCQVILKQAERIIENEYFG